MEDFSKVQNFNKLMLTYGLRVFDDFFFLFIWSQKAQNKKCSLNSKEIEKDLGYRIHSNISKSFQLA